MSDAAKSAVKLREKLEKNLAERAELLKEADTLERKAGDCRRRASELKDENSQLAIGLRDAQVVMATERAQAAAEQANKEVQEVLNRLKEKEKKLDTIITKRGEAAEAKKKEE